MIPERMLPETSVIYVCQNRGLILQLAVSSTYEQKYKIMNRTEVDTSPIIKYIT